MAAATMPVILSRPEIMLPIASSVAAVTKTTTVAKVATAAATVAGTAAAAVAEAAVIYVPAVEIVAPFTFACAGGIVMAGAGLAIYGTALGIGKAVSWLCSSSEPKVDAGHKEATPPEERKETTTKKCAMSNNGFESDSDDECLDLEPGKDDNGKEPDDGQRKKKAKIHPTCVSRSDDQFSSETIEKLMSGEELIRNEPTVTGALTGSYHLVRRLTRYLRVVGMATYVEHKTGVSRLNLFHPGPSLTKDHVCSITGHNACHVVRLQLSPSVVPINLNIVQILRVFLGHTHCVHYKFNKCIGKEIDTLQGKMLETLLCICWEQGLTDDNRAKLILIKETWLKLLSKAVKTKYLEGQPEQLQIAFNYIQAMDSEYLFDKILVGYVYMRYEMNDISTMNQLTFSNDILKKLSQKTFKKPKLFKNTKTHSFVSPRS